MCEKQNRENTCQRKINHMHKTVFMWLTVFMWFGNLPTSTELQGFHCFQGKKYKVWQYSSPTSFQIGSSSRSNTTRLHKVQQISHLETSSITNINYNPPKTIPHPCNSSSCPQARRPTEVAHNFSFSIVIPLVNMFVGFLDQLIFSSITNLSSTR